MATLQAQQNHAALIKSLERAQPGSLVRAANVTGFDVRDGKAMYSIVVIPGEGKAAELSYTLYKSQEDWERIRKSVEAATKMHSPFPKKKSFGSPSHRDFSVRKDQFHAWLNEALEKSLKMPIVQRAVLKWLDVHIYCAIALAPGTMDTYAGPSKGNVVKGVAAGGAAEQEFAPMGTVVAGGAAEQEFAPMGTVVAGGAAEQEFAPMGAVQATPTIVQPTIVQAAPAVVQPAVVQAAPAVVVVDKSGYS